MVHLVIQHTAVTRQTQAAKSHPFGSIRFNCACGASAQLRVGRDTPRYYGSWVKKSRLGPVLAGLPCQQTGFTIGTQPVLAERYVHVFSLRAAVFNIK